MVERLRRRYSKLCDIRDFEDPDLIRRMRELQPDPDPAVAIERKLWEEGMLALFLEDTGVLCEDAAVLSVGAGTEPVLYWLANHVGRVVATDIYGEGDFAGREARVSMLDDPDAFAPFDYRRERLEVRKMDARRLEFPDASFDAVYTLSSIEHFGSPADIAGSAREIGRVLKPGGVAFIVTELLVRLHPLDRAPVEAAVRLATAGLRKGRATFRRRVALDDAFTAGELGDRIVGPSGLSLMQPLDASVSPGSWGNLARYAPGSEEVVTPSGSFYPHILLQISRSVIGSVALPLQRPV